jgi:hypothetical protein
VNVSGIAGRIVREWLRRYARAGIVLVGVCVVIALLPSTIKRVAPIAAPSLPPLSAPTPVAVAPPSSVAPPATAPASVVIAPLLAPPTSVIESPRPTSRVPVVPTVPATPNAIPTCPIKIPSPTTGPTSTPVLLVLLPLSGPFGAEALAFLDLIGPLLPAVTPLFPVINPTLANVQPALASAVSGAVLVEQAVFGPLGPQITSFTPQALSGEKEVIALLEPTVDAIGKGPIVGCAYELTSALAAGLG